MRLRWLVLVLLLSVAGLTWLVLSPAPAVRQGPLVVTIPPHEGLLGIAGRLAEAQVIRSRLAFVAAVVVRGVPRSLKAGEYEVVPDATTWDIVRLLESGRVRQHAILHPEGATVAELARALEAERLAGVEAVARAAADRKFLDASGIEGPSVEARGPRHRPPVQHLRALRAAAGADRQSGAGGDPGRPRSGTREVPLFRRARRPPPPLLHDRGGAQRRRHALPPVAPLAGGRTSPGSML